MTQFKQTKPDRKGKLSEDVKSGVSKGRTQTKLSSAAENLKNGVCQSRRKSIKTLYHHNHSVIFLFGESYKFNFKKIVKN